MIQSDKRPVQSDFANLTDYSLQRPQGMKRFYVFVHFTDDSICLWSNIFALDRRTAHLLVIEKFNDCLDYIGSINVHESEY